MSYNIAKYNITLRKYEFSTLILPVRKIIFYLRRGIECMTYIKHIKNINILNTLKLIYRIVLHKMKLPSTLLS